MAAGDEADPTGKIIVATVKRYSISDTAEGAPNAFWRWSIRMD
jgi:hypothetical protein